MTHRDECTPNEGLNADVLRVGVKTQSRTKPARRPARSRAGGGYPPEIPRWHLQQKRCQLPISEA
eukprot:6213950-Pleurochrysis_carterae.AAC.3